MKFSNFPIEWHRPNALSSQVTLEHSNSRFISGQISCWDEGERAEREASDKLRTEPANAMPLAPPTPRATASTISLTLYALSSTAILKLSTSIVRRRMCMKKKTVKFIYKDNRFCVTFALFVDNTRELLGGERERGASKSGRHKVNVKSVALLCWREIAYSGYFYMWFFCWLNFLFSFLLCFFFRQTWTLSSFSSRPAALYTCNWLFHFLSMSEKRNYEMKTFSCNTFASAWLARLLCCVVCFSFPFHFFFPFSSSENEIYAYCRL